MFWNTALLGGCGSSRCARRLDGVDAELDQCLSGWLAPE
jgi:hypothetical protein